MTETAFPGFPAETLDFLSDLKANNNRQWFADNKDVYERAVKQPADRFCAAMVGRLEALTGTTHASRIYRLHRDLRFAKDKTPYNAHLHIAFTPEGANSSPPCWFFGLEPGRLTLGAGVFAFDKPALEHFRECVAGPAGAELSRRLKEIGDNGARIGKPDLARVPAGHPKDHPHADLLRRKGLTAWIDIDPPDTATRGDFMDGCLGRFAQLKPLVDWLLSALQPQDLC